MKCDTAGRRVAHATLIPLLLIVVGIFVWGVRYKLSLYDSPVSPSRSVAEAKLLSPNERPGSVHTASQIRPQFIPASQIYFQIVLIATIFMSILVGINAKTSPNAPYQAACSSSFFSFRPPPALLFA